MIFYLIYIIRQRCKIFSLIFFFPFKKAIERVGECEFPFLRNQRSRFFYGRALAPLKCLIQPNNIARWYIYWHPNLDWDPKKTHTNGESPTQNSFSPTAKVCSLDTLPFSLFERYIFYLSKKIEKMHLSFIPCPTTSTWGFYNFLLIFLGQLTARSGFSTSFSTQLWTWDIVWVWGPPWSQPELISFRFLGSVSSWSIEAHPRLPI